MMGFPGSSMGKESTCNAGDTGGMGSIPGSEEEGMATHSGILDWRISWAEEPGRLQSIIIKSSVRTVNLTKGLTCIDFL